MRATQILEEKGISILHLHISTLKPFSDPIMLDALSKAKHGIITMENHTIIGGLGTATAENGIGTRLHRIGINDTYAHGASHPYLQKKYGLDAIALVRRVEELLGKNFNISENDLANVRLEEASAIGSEQLEAL